MKNTVTDTCPHLCVMLKDAGDHTYPKAFSAMYCSIRATTQSRLIVSIVHDNTVSEEALGLLKTLAAGNDEFRFIDVSKANFHDFCETHAIKRYSSAVLWRVFLPEILADCGKVIVCDADLIFLTDIAGIWDTPLSKGHCLAAVKRRKPLANNAYYQAIETEPGDYFRMTLTLMDLQAIRNDDRFMQQRRRFIEQRLAEINRLIPLSEQSVFNYFFSKKCSRLDISMVAITDRLDFSGNTVLDIKGWHNDNPLSQFYWAFLLGGPWRGESESEFFLSRFSRRVKKATNNLLARFR